MIQRPLDAISRADIDALIANCVTECKTLEYKQELPDDSVDAKKEFLADVSSFANSSGGDIVFGMKAAIDASGGKTGAAECVHPIVGTTADEAKLRLENMIRDGINPRLRVQIKEVLGWGADERGFVILLRIPRSFASPHMVTFKGTSRFYSRHSAGKFPLDVAEIRAAFLATESQAERIKRFREDRLSKVVSDETPVILGAPPRIVLHLIPVASFLNSEHLDLPNKGNLLNGFPPIAGTRFEPRYKLDGFLTWIPSWNRAEHRTHGFGYCQLFSHGAIEAAGAGSLLGGTAEDGQSVIASDYEVHVVDAVDTYLQGYKLLGLTPPVVIALSLLGCKGACLSAGGQRGWPPDSIDRDAAVLPEVVIESLDVNVPQVMKPIFDLVWNACGYPYSCNYEQKSGKWQPQRR